MLIVVGSYNQDLVWRTPQFPKAGETRTGFFSQGPGGKGFNQAMAAQRLGSQPLFIAALGSDALGDNAQKLAKAEHLHCAWQRIESTATGNAAIWLDMSGQNQILVDLAANQQLSAEHISAQAGAFSSAKAVLVQYEANLAASLQALLLARKYGAVCLVNPAPASAEANDLLAMADIITPNESEFAALLAQNGEAINAESVAALSAGHLHALARRLPCATVIITLGSRGVLLSTDNGFEEISAPAVAVRDTTGAGDCFNGGLAAELANGKPLTDACAFSVKAASCKVERAGAALAMPTRADITARFG
jgi:ribokinase